jgi:1,4-alpha-glucan branching enzyme
VVSSGSTEGGDDELLPLPAPSAPSLGTFASNNDGGTGSSAPVPTAFRFKAANAKQVAIVGDFNAWDPSVAPLIRNADGTWGGTVALLPGRHTYAFMIDGRIVPDPTAINVRDPDYDVIVSTIVVREPGQ